jgi:hypothetical protein
MNYDKRCCRLRRWTVPCAMLFVFSVLTIALRVFLGWSSILFIPFAFAVSPLYILARFIEISTPHGFMDPLIPAMIALVLLQYYFLWWSGCMWLQADLRIHWLHWLVLFLFIGGSAFRLLSYL